MIENFGGFPFVEPDNLANKHSLLYILEAITTTYFGQDLYPTIPAKAAAIGWNIIAKHIFRDGNKRTGMITCQLFLDINDYDLKISIDPENDIEAVTIAENIAKHEVEIDEFTAWVESRTN